MFHHFLSFTLYIDDDTFSQLPLIKKHVQVTKQNILKLCIFTSNEIQKQIFYDYPNM